jgi:preprotein translocase subunit SecD
MTAKCKFGLDIVGGTIVRMKIFEMDERFRYKSEDGKDRSYEASNGVNIVSVDFPKLGDIISRKVMLRGSVKEKDNAIAISAFTNEKDAQVFHDAIIFAMKEWAEKWPGFYPPSEPAIFDYIFEV